jgi:hypothetical protein
VVIDGNQSHQSIWARIVALRRGVTTAGASSSPARRSARAEKVASRLVAAASDLEGPFHLYHVIAETLARLLLGHAVARLPAPLSAQKVR